VPTFEKRLFFIVPLLFAVESLSVAAHLSVAVLHYLPPHFM
jgi:hypothetical protein